MKLQAIFASLLCLSSAAFAGEVVGRASVVDGDTLEVRGTRIRLSGIDAPESSQTCSVDGRPYRCGQKAAQVLDRLVAGKTVRCREQDQDRYGRTVATCFVANLEVNAEMVRLGWAVAYRKYDASYIKEEDEAKRSQAGIWAGAFQMPEEYRRSRRQGRPSVEAPAAAGPGHCTIKGNTSASGDRVYHLPGGDAYARTRIDESKGERWFCSPAEAEEAGWRPAGRPR